MSEVYRVLTGLNIEDERHEPGDLVTDVPDESLDWLLDQGHIEPVEDEDEDE